MFFPFILLMCTFSLKCVFSFQSVILKLLVFQNLLKLQMMGSHTIPVKVDSGCVGSRPWSNFLSNSHSDPGVDECQIFYHICNIFIFSPHLLSVIFSFYIYFKKIVMIKGKKNSLCWGLVHRYLGELSDLRFYNPVIDLAIQEWSFDPYLLLLLFSCWWISWLTFYFTS